MSLSVAPLSSAPLSAGLIARTSAEEAPDATVLVELTLSVAALGGAEPPQSVTSTVAITLDPAVSALVAACVFAQAETAIAFSILASGSHSVSSAAAVALSLNPLARGVRGNAGTAACSISLAATGLCAHGVSGSSVLSSMLYVTVAGHAIDLTTCVAAFNAPLLISAMGSFPHFPDLVHEQLFILSAPERFSVRVPHERRLA